MAGIVGRGIAEELAEFGGRTLVEEGGRAAGQAIGETALAAGERAAFDATTAATTREIAAVTAESAIPVMENSTRGATKSLATRISNFGKGIRAQLPEGRQALYYARAAGATTATGVGAYTAISYTNRGLRVADDLVQVGEGLGKGVAGAGKSIGDAIAATRADTQATVEAFGTEASAGLETFGDGVASTVNSGWQKATELAEGSANMMPNMSDINDISNGLRNGAHDITGSINDAQTTMLTVGAILLGAVVLFEGYRFFR